MTPTRELAVQVKNHIEAIAKYTDIKAAVIVGGMAVQKQIRYVLTSCGQVVRDFEREAKTRRNF